MKPLAISIFIVFGCGQKRDPFPYTVQSDESSDVEEGEQDGPVRPDCVDTWAILADGTTIQPELCLLWSPPSEDSMSWSEAASIEDGEAGGCGSDCPDGGGHCATLSFDDKSNWRLPSFEELKTAALSNPEIPDLDGKLWSRDSGQGSTANAWVVDLGQPGFWVELDKEDSGISVRCVSG